MSLPIGQTLAHYEILEPIGKGGMGEVYRARDRKLGRDVAVKVLPHEFADDEERLKRFEREAKVLASLNHPNIASIYGLDRSGSTHYLVLELVEGETLAERLSRGPVPLDEAVEIASKLTEALGAAHELGIVHRDLKPPNIKLTPEDDVKVLDFGLAKVFADESSSADSEESPTFTKDRTGHGVILGTAAYMSPEQARGKKVDRRADIWAFGVVLWQMLTGRRLFEGETVSDVLAAVLRAEPAWDTLPPETPPSIRRLLKRCLERDPKERLHDIRDARFELDESRTEVDSEPASTRNATGRSPRPWLVAGGGLVAGALLASLSMALIGDRSGRLDVGREPLHLTLSGPSFNSESVAAISPDGRFVAYASYTELRNAPLHIRSLANYDTVEISGSEGANPFFSPDGDSVAFFRRRSLVTVPTRGGTVRELAPTSATFPTGSWGPEGDLVFSDGVFDGRGWRGLTRLRPGGSPEKLTEPVGGERHVHPRHLPGGRFLLYAKISSTHEVMAVDLRSGETHEVLDGFTTPRYVATGYLLAFSPGTQELSAVAFDLETATARGAPVPLQHIYRSSVATGGYDVSESGTLIYEPQLGVAGDGDPDASAPYRLVWVDRAGRIEPISAERGTWAEPRLSPDASSIVVRRTATPDCSLWSFDLRRGALTRLTFALDTHSPVWHPTGKQIAFTAADDGLYVLSADGSGTARPLYSPEQARGSSLLGGGGGWSPDGQHFVFTLVGAETSGDLWVYDAVAKEPRPFLVTPFEENYGAFSPSGRFIAYTSNESGDDEVYVRSFPEGDRRVQISVGGGTGAVWSRDGRELFYARGEDMMSVSFQDDELLVGAPEKLFHGPFVWERVRNYDVAPDGKRFLMLEREGGVATHEEIRVVVNWDRELERLAPLETEAER